MGSLSRRIEVSLRRKLIIFMCLCLVLACLFALLAIGLNNRSSVTGLSGVTRVGKPAPEFSIPLLGGGTIELSAHLGDPIVLNFWASWCPPCRQESPVLERAWRKYSGRGVQFVGVNIQDSPHDGQAYLDEFDLTFPNGIDSDGVVTVDYGVIGLPVTFFIGADGTVEGRWVGELPEEKLVDWVEALIAGTTQPGGLDTERSSAYFEIE